MTAAHQAQLASLVFSLAILAYASTKLWLASRQIRAIARNRDAVPPAFAHSIPLATHQKGADYAIAKLRFGFNELGISLVVLLGWTLLGGLNWLNVQLLQWVGPRPLLQPLALVAAFVVINAIIDTPAALYQTFGIEQRFGFNRMTWRLWLTDTLKSTLLAVVIGLPLTALVLWLMQATGRWWWLWTWGAWMVFTLLMLVLYPTLIAPLFNKFTPLQDATLKQAVEGLMQRCGFAARGLYVMDGSRRSAHGNAYFTGLGAAKRVVFFDTLLRQLTPPEVEAVLAHELGHYKLHHVLKHIVLLFAASLVALALLGWLAQQPWFYFGLGVVPNFAFGADVPDNAIALLLFLLVIPVFGLFLTPLLSATSRKHEFEADAYAARHADPEQLRHALIKLHKDNASTLTPDPMYVRFYYSHPPATERLTALAAAATHPT